MNEWKDNDLEKVKVIIEIPKNTIAFIVNTISDNKGVIAMSNTQYDSKDVKRLEKEIKELVGNNENT